MTLLQRWQDRNIQPNATYITSNDVPLNEQAARQKRDREQAIRDFAARAAKEAERTNTITEAEPVTVSAEQRAAIFGTKFKHPDGVLDRGEVQVQGSIADAIRGGRATAPEGESPLQVFARQARETEERERRERLDSYSAKLDQIEARKREEAA